MKIESFEIKHNQYLRVTLSGNETKIIFNLAAYKAGIAISGDKKSIWLNESVDRYDVINADCDLSPIIEAWELANLGK